ncbi:hypothetical protein [Methanoregula sp.]|jgi:hypothetical protein|uniref:hypothetical protein n=1 Tax=Methanoregula sp. TaxID=2052170 RepID=UPI003565BD59
MKKIPWILSGLTALIIAVTVCQLLRVNLISLFKPAGWNPFSFFIGPAPGMGIGYSILGRDNGPGSTQDA